MPHLSNELKDLFVTLETKFHPLSLCKKVNAVLDGLSDNEDYKLYITPIQEIAIARTLKQVKLTVLISLRKVAGTIVQPLLPMS